MIWVRVWLAVALLSLSACAAAGPEKRCGTVEGAYRLPSAGVIVIGDYHGANEPPRVFHDLVCGFAKRAGGGRFVVGLELPDGFNRAFSMIGRRDATRQAIARVKGDPFWNDMGDGRHSEAMLKMTVDLMELAGESASSIKLVAVERPGIDIAGAQFFDREMKRYGMSHGVVLIGNAHARRAKMPKQRTKPFAQTLQESGHRVTSLNIAPGGGVAWFCSPACAATPLPAKNRGAKPFVEYRPCTQSTCAYDGIYYVPALTVSKPVRR